MLHVETSENIIMESVQTSYENTAGLALLLESHMEKNGDSDNVMRTVCNIVRLIRDDLQRATDEF